MGNILTENIRSNLKVILPLFFLSLVVKDVQAEGKNEIVIPMDISSWFYQGEWYECSLFHAETKHGKFYFRSLPGNKVSFEIQTKENNTYHGTNLYTISPPWKNSAEKRFISASAAKNGSGHYVFSQGIEELVSHVANGEWIQVSFQNQQASALNLVIPSIRVRDAVTAFSSCTSKLPEMAYEDARTLELTFAHGQSVLHQEQKNILSAFRSYVVLDPSVEKVLIDGHTDAIGSRVANLKTSKARADEVARVLESMGIDKAMLEVRAHGERYPIASNENAEGRQKNRRVTLRLVMDTDRVTSEADKANTTKTTTNETAKVQK